MLKLKNISRKCDDNWRREASFYISSYGSLAPTLHGGKVTFWALTNIELIARAHVALGAALNASMVSKVTFAKRTRHELSHSRMRGKVETVLLFAWGKQLTLFFWLASSSIIYSEVQYLWVHPCCWANGKLLLGNGTKCKYSGLPFPQDPSPYVFPFPFLKGLPDMMSASEGGGGVMEKWM